MSIITVDKASLAFGHHNLLSNISFGIERSDKIGLIGRNGSGKSSLLKAIANLINLDNGRIYIADETKIVYVAQEPILDPSHTIYDEVFMGLGEIKDKLYEYYKLLDKLAHEYSEEIFERLHIVQESLEHSNAWQAKVLVDRILSELSLNGELLIKDLSGGVKKKVAIAKALVATPDVILFDEPTNHLDIEAILWLEDVIKNFNGAILLISHDRVFLDRTINKILELDRGNLNQYPGSYAKYLEVKERQLADEAKTNHEFDKFLAQEEVWIRKGVEARRTRNEGRVRRLEELRKIRSERRDKVGKVNFKVDRGELSGKIVAELEKVNISFNEKTIIKDFSTTIMRGDKVGLVGPNGIGKSTLLKVILNELVPDSGIVKLGTKIEVAYFDQFREQLDENATIQDVVSKGQDFVEINGHKLHIATYLEEFLFAPARFRSQVKSLSGGERNRLLLARIFSRPANVLVLDEPTNDLDIETLELLEELLINYSGTVFLVSHDRKFLDNVVTQTYIFQGKGQVFEFFGGYSDWIMYNEQHYSKISDDVDSVVKSNKNKYIKNSKKLSYMETQELTNLPLELERLETEQKDLQAKLMDAGFYTESTEIVRNAQIRVNELDELILVKMKRWEELEQKRLGE